MASDTGPEGGLSITTKSYWVLRSAITWSILDVSSNSAGLGGMGPAVMKSRFSIWLWRMHSFSVFLPIRMVLMPKSLSVSKPTCILGLRMSQSNTITLWPLNAKIPAKLMETKVLPSPEIVR